ncbi:adenylate/guanylate cyclase domain-containing protein [Mesorhizobium sp. KR2-14]|uniref:adenylate/guanylate cyclase domain-containing protein n=1 Tax=Mesorhizobium sp. KR2-14 TaxID=3156610 RepID=UPI0032B5B7AC
MSALSEILADLGFTHYGALFESNHIDDSMLADLTADDLREIGVTSLGHRKKILAAIAERPAALHPAPLRPDGTSPTSAKRREVTTVFADLTDYTKLSQELGTEDMHSLLTEFYDWFDAIIRRLGGTVDRHIGDCVMAVFGAPISYGNDAERALRTAVEMHRAMTEISSRFGRQLSVHIGVAAGNVIFSSQGMGALKDREFTLTGDSVNLASRLANQAKGTETLITRLIHQALSDRIECEARDSLTVKGFDQPIEVYRLVGFRDSAADHPLIGRADEVAQFTQALSDCQASARGGAIALVAEAGLGKSRLIEEFARIAADQQFQVHKALVLDFGLSDAQSPVRLLLGSLFGLSERAEASAVRSVVLQQKSCGTIDETAAMFLTIVLGAPLDQEARQIHDAMSDAARKEGLRAMLGQVLRAVAATGQLLLIVEDIHWADRTTLRELAEVAAVTADAPILLLMSARPEGYPLNEGWCAEAREATLTRIDLAPLSAEDAYRLARATHRPSEAVMRECVARAEGNPLYLDQLLRHAHEQGGDTLPGSIQSIIQSRLDRLSPMDRKVLEAAAILGQRFSMAEVMAVARIEVYDERPLIEASLIRAHNHIYLFDHALIRDAVLRTMLRDDLRTQHRRAAEWFRPVDALRHAEHLAAASDEGAAAAFLAAARDALAAHRKDSALALAERGVALAAQDAVRGDLLRLKGDMLRDLGRATEAIAAFEAASAIALTPADQCRSLIGIISAMRILDRIDDAFALLDETEAIAAAADLAPELSEIHYFRGSLHFPRGQLDGCLREHALSLNYAERAGNAERRALALSGLGDAHYARGRLFTAHSVIQQCLALCEEHHLGAVEAANRFMLATVKIYMNDTESALAEALASARLAQRVGLARAEIVSRLTAGWVLVSMGDATAAQSQMDLGLGLATQLGARRFEPFLKETVARVRLVEGRRNEAAAVAEEALAQLRDLDAMAFIGPWLLSTVALTTPDAGRRAEALAEGEERLRAGAVGHNYFQFYGNAMEANSNVGDWAEMRRHADLLAEYTAEEPTPWSEFFIARAHAITDAAAGRDAGERLRALREQALAAKLHTAVPGIDRALATISAGVNKATA